jgi:hypothetical protein
MEQSAVMRQTPAQVRNFARIASAISEIGRAVPAMSGASLDETAENLSEGLSEAEILRSLANQLTAFAGGDASSAATSATQ